MSVSAQRFKFLDQQTNVGVADFSSLSGTGMLNTLPIQTGNLSSLNGLGIGNLQGMIGNNSLPNLSGLTGLLSKSGINLKGLNINGLAGMLASGKLSAASLMGMLSGSPAILGMLTKYTGIKDLSKLMPTLMRLMAANNTANGVVASTPSATYVTNNVTLNQIAIEQKNTNSALSAYSNQTISYSPIVTKAGVTIASNSTPLTSAQTVTALSTIMPVKSPTLDAIKILPSDIKQSVITAMSDTVSSSHIVVNGVNTPIDVTTPSLGGYIESVTKLTNGAYAPVIVNSDLTAKTITSLVDSGKQLGLPPTFSKIAATYNDPVAVTSAGAVVLGDAVSKGDINAFIDVASSSHAAAIYKSMPVVDNVTSNLTMPPGASGKDLVNIHNQFITALATMDPNWSTSSTNPTTVSVAKLCDQPVVTGNIASSTQTTANGVVTVTPVPVVANTTSPGVTVAASVSKAVMSSKVIPNTVQAGKLIDSANTATDSVSIPALVTAPPIGVNQVFWQLCAAKTSSLIVPTPTLTPSTPREVQASLGLDQWLITGLAFGGTSVASMLKKYFPDVSPVIHDTNTPYLFTSPLIMNGIALG